MCNNVIQFIAALHAALTAPVGVLPTSYDDAIIVIRFGAR